MNAKLCSLHPTSMSEIPTTPFFAILRPRSTFVPGDERSRTNPGHGYPEHTEHSWDIEIFADEEHWRKEIEAIETRAKTGRGYEQYRAVQITPANIKTHVTIDVDVRR